MTNAMIVGISIVVAGGVGLTLIVWTNCLSSLLLELTKIPLLGKIINKIREIRTMFSNDKDSISKSAKEIILSIIGSVVFSGISLFSLAQSLGLNQIFKIFC